MKVIGYFGELAKVSLLGFLDFWCYVVMMVVTLQNPGILTLFYPFSIFGYALMEVFRPSRRFWQAVMVYT